MTPTKKTAPTPKGSKAKAAKKARPKPKAALRTRSGAKLKPKPKTRLALKPKKKPAAKVKTLPKTGVAKVPETLPQAELIELVVRPEQVRGRLDKVLTAELAPRSLSRSRVKRLLDDGHVTVDGELRPARYHLRLGQVLRVTLAVDGPTALQPAAIPLRVLYEDKDLIVIDKQAGLVTHPGAGHDDDTLANALLHHCGKSIQAIGGVRRPGIVHRLDKDTSGCLVAAKSEAAFVGLQAMIAAREVTRLYLALVWGDIREDSGTIDAPIGRGGDRQKMALRDTGKPAITHFMVRERYAQSCELECRLETGRTHQIRAHLNGIGHSVVGDLTYGRLPGHLPAELRESLPKILARQALHAWKLQFKHPVTGKLIQAQAEEPADYKAARRLLKAAA